MKFGHGRTSLGCLVKQTLLAVHAVVRRGLISSMGGSGESKSCRKVMSSDCRDVQIELHRQNQIILLMGLQPRPARATKT